MGSNLIRRRAISARSLASLLLPCACLSSASSSARRCSVNRERSLDQPLVERDAEIVQPFKQFAATQRGEVAANARFTPV